MRLCLLLLSLLLPASAATITLVPSITNPAVGGAFTADVRVTGVFDGLPGEELILFGFDVLVGDPSAVAFLGSAAGPLFDPAGLAGADVSGFPKGFSLVEGDFTEPLLLATLQFQRLSKAAFSIRVLADPDANPDHGLFYLNTVLPVDAALSIGAIPEPSTLAMFAAATLAVCVTRRPWRLR